MADEKPRSSAVFFLHYLPFWIFGMALLLPFVCVGVGFCISCFGNIKLLCDFQDFAALLLTSWLLSLIWSFLIHRFWKKEEREPRFPDHSGLRRRSGFTGWTRKNPSRRRSLSSVSETDPLC